MNKKTDNRIINPTRKLVIGILITLTMTTLCWLLMFVLNVATSREVSGFLYNVTGGRLGSAVFQYDSIRETTGGIAEIIDHAVESYHSQLQTKADLSARACLEMVNALGDNSITKVGKGSIVKIENGAVTICDGVRTGIRGYGDRITETKGLLDYRTPTRNGVRRDILVYSRVKGPYYYVEIVNGEEMLAYIDMYVDYDSLMKGMEDVNSVGIFLICPDKEKSRYFYNLEGNLVYYPGKTEAGEYLGKVSTEDFGLPSDKSSLLNLNGKIEYDESGQEQNYVTYEVKELDCVIVILVRDLYFAGRVKEQTRIGFSVILVLTITFIIWLCLVYREMTQGNMTEIKKEKYSPSRVRLIAISYGTLSVIIVFVLSVFFRSMSNIYTEIIDIQNSLNVINSQIESNASYQEKKESARKTLYLEYAGRAAKLIDTNPELNNKEDLADLSRIIGAEYIMLFDSSGKEIGTSSEYINMELGKDESGNATSTADFRRILNGVPGIAHEAVKDEVTGRKLELYGIRMNDTKTGTYGVLLVAVKPETSGVGGETLTVNNILTYLTPTGKTSLRIDPETGTINATNNYVLASMYVEAEDLGFGSSMLKDGVADFTRIGSERYFCGSKKARSGEILYICTPDTMILGNGMEYGLICGVGFSLVFFLLCLYLLRGYSNEMIEAVEERNRKAAEEKKEQQNEETVPQTIRARLSDFFKHILGKSKPEKIALKAFEVMLGLTFIDVLRDLEAGNAFGEQLVMNYVLAGKWNKGFNIFSMTSIVLLLVAVLFGVLFVKFIFSVGGRMLNSRGNTICRMISNLITYIAVIAFIYYALSFLGVDTKAILASVGVFGIGLSVGAKDLISDMFAGISMIFEGNYQVGDIVNIDGYRGMVEEVGVRSTRLIGRGGNIKVIGNQSIKSVMNLTKMNSWVNTTIKVDVNYPLRDAEEIIGKAIPNIANENEKIISGPYYKGVQAVENGYAVLAFNAECKESDFYDVERILVREILLALREKNVPVK